MNEIGLAVAVISLLALGATGADATTYFLTGIGQDASSYTITGSITTDGATGALAPGDILGWNVVLTYGSSTYDLNSSNSTLEYFGGITATSSELFFPFSSSGTVVLQFDDYNPSIPSDVSFALASEGVTSLPFGAVQAYTTDHGFGDTFLNGTLEFAATPEPATWALMLAGFAGLGAMLRRRAARIA